MRFKKTLLALAVAGVALVGFTASANATPVTPLHATGVQPNGSFNVCIRPNGDWAAPSTNTHACPAGYAFINVAATGHVGATGATGPAGPAGATGATGATGPAGPAGTSAVTSVSHTTSITSWPESSGWASDDFTRKVDVTNNGAADVDKCGGAAKCYLFTFTLTDNGTFTTVNGADSPNGTADNITGAFAGTFQGVAVGQFYADSASLSGTVPVAATGAAKPASTTNWATLATTGNAFGTKLTAYSWDYNLTIQAGAGCTNVSHQEWLDAINPGDDGQSAADGNIVGATNCN